MDPEVKIVGFGEIGSEIADSVGKKVVQLGLSGVECYLEKESADMEFVMDRNECGLLLLVAGADCNCETSVVKMGERALKSGVPVGAFVVSPSFDAEKDRSLLEQSVDFYHVMNDGECAAERIVNFVQMFKSRGMIMVDFADFLAVIKLNRPRRRLTCLETCGNGEKWIINCAKELTETFKQQGLDSNGFLVQIEHDKSLTLEEYSEAVESFYDSGCAKDDTNIIISDITNENAEKSGRIRMWTV
ncbi:hypothetical protein [Fibrobacter sp. UWH1]|uniref:hypothetical protein n=1 Tax=Fibrobacter sp. UWH1 TaxID=1964354 RepID=UPI000B52800C|nr:hypothetical protein [Fibrobacter sp. UWH1]OWV05876.1 hypothetical protein B7992_15220 [Fibrobacter sp. UWH1]